MTIPINTIDVFAVREAFSPMGHATHPINHAKRRRLLRDGLWIDAKPRELIACNSIEMGACLASLILDAGRLDLLKTITHSSPGMAQLAEALDRIARLDDDRIVEWWSDVIEASTTHDVGHRAIDSCLYGTTDGMRSVVSNLSVRLSIAADEPHAMGTGHGTKASLNRCRCEQAQTQST